MATFWVTLYKNDGRLESTDAQPFSIDPFWNIDRVRYEAHKTLHGSTNRFCRLFTEFGVEVANADDIAPMQSLVVSQGEDFVPVQHLAFSWDLGTNGMAESLLEGMYGDPTGDLMPMDGILQQADTELQRHYGRGLGDWVEATIDGPHATAPVNPQLQAIFTTMQLPSIHLPPPTHPGLPHPGPTLSPMHHPQAFAASTPANVPATPPETPASSVGSSVGSARGDSSPEARPRGTSVADLKVSPASLPPMSAGLPAMQPTHMAPPGYGYSAAYMPPPNVAPSVADSWDSRSMAGDRTQLAEKAESHKASEQRSRDKLKTSIRELVMTVPSLATMKKPSKAVVIKKATDFVNHQKRVAQGLRAENEMYKQELAKMHMERSRLQHELKLGSIVTVEMVTPDLRYIFVDHNWEIIYGYARHEVVGKLILDVMGCPKCPLQYNRCKQVHEALDRKQPWHGLVVVRRKDGQCMACEATISPVLDSEGAVMQFMSVRKNFHLITKDQGTQLLQTLVDATASNELERAVEDTRQVVAQALSLHQPDQPPAKAPAIVPAQHQPALTSTQ